MRAHNTPVHRAEKLLAVRRLAEGKTSHKALARKYDTTERQIKSWVSSHKKGRLLKTNHHMWNPCWSKENVIVHPLDEDILVSIKKGRPNYEDSIISLLDPTVDPINGCTHVEWTDNQIDRLLLWMVDRALVLIRDVALATDEFKEEQDFVNSKMFSVICKSLGYDVDALRAGIDAEIAYRKGQENTKSI
ncbi:hypothetical protein C9975_02980 [Thalassospira xiamenensis]|nr:hypothetical protein C9975_02980 [Thalassospira xiamenensis]